MKRERKLASATDLIAFLRSLDPAERVRAIDRLGIMEGDALDRDWPSWAHDGQRPPPDAGTDQDWRTWVILAGRGFGKTRAGAQWITQAIDTARGTGELLRIALVGATMDDARRVMIEGQSGLLAVAADHVAGWWPSRHLLKFAGGSEAVLFSGASPEALRGPEHHLAWCDELAKWEQPGHCWDMLQLGLRLGDRPRTLVTTTPRGGAAIERILASPGTILTGGSTRANPHLPAAFKTAVYDLYHGTRLGAQELDGQLLTDTPGALWTIELLESCRVRDNDPIILSLSKGRIVIGVDPPSGDGTCGIIACARDTSGLAHVLADRSVTACSPERWARAVADVAAMHADPLILAEGNQGGNMVKSVLHQADPALRIKLVTATIGKSARAEPVAMLFEQHKVRIHGHFPALEAELLTLIAGDPPNKSPDRADAMIWALTELMLGKERIPRVEQL